MAQQKGHTGNPNGRPKGVPNKTTTTVRRWIVNLIQNNMEQFETDLLMMEPKERLDFISKLLPYILPKPEKPTDVEGAVYCMDDVKFSSFGHYGNEVERDWWRRRELDHRNEP